MTTTEPPHYPSVEAFYAADPRRRNSPEAYYGVWWREEGSAGPWRVSYIQATGEVYAEERGGKGRVEVLGIIPPDNLTPGAIYYRTLDHILHGWAYAGHLSWVRERLAAATRTAHTQEGMP